MEAPARAARRLLFGLGIALLLATAFALIDGRLPPSECPEDTYNCTASNDMGWLLPAATVVTLLAGYILHLGIEKGVNSPLLKLFPSGGSSAQREALLSDISDSQDEDSLSDAWADLEQGLLSSKEKEEE
ncbi:MAG TPA: hypothetical protein HA340_03805 [Candidatus Thalassarchaeaceae archaeon]|jgi:hypothetical protein|nr:hypothetical protein [Euryarchaeota archaeon]MDP6378881.1 hypothetical protein [Candidatus Thalassarchaeaceae archaeon]DAC50332.1 MAG TPA: hypothetical protein D7H97_03765 [Candidatus Poseidoniales archaeon]HIH83052.1 hypothetical protein [Candidatus Thalassarchaeaceae archaeon]|tara:strand:- start:549 stop:938 length:390 start_codon:yes stop_codon:yes gene_type:complete